MDTDYSFVWVLLIALIGISVSIYSLCKGCRGYNDRGIGARALVAPYAGLLQQTRAEAAIRARFFSISGNSVGDKHPPTYDELFAAPPPSYEESLRMLQITLSPKDKDDDIMNKESTSSEKIVNSSEKEPRSAETQEAEQYTNSDDTLPDYTTVVMPEENDELARRHEVAAIHTTSVVVDIEVQRHRESVTSECVSTNL